VSPCAAGHEVPPDSPEGLCPLCLVSLADAALVRAVSAAGAAPANPDVPLIPLRRFGPFRIVRELGRGGYGCVYLAERDGAAQLVALKVLRDVVLADVQSLRRFRQEPTLSARLDPNRVVQVLEAGDVDGQPYFVMEYLPGGTLRERMASYRGDPVAAAKLMIEIAQAVQHLHRDEQHPSRQAILHCDLKPENILFDADDRPHISDFGIAKLGNTQGRWSPHTLHVGCPPYMAPEQLRARRPELTAGVDVYALGVILYELFTGRVPFDGDVHEISAALKEEEPSSPRRFVPELDRFFETVVLNALEKDPARRYHSAAAFAQDLQRALRQEPPREAPPVPPRARLWSWIRKRPLQSAFALWCLALLCVVGLSAIALLASEAKNLERDQQLNGSIAGMQAVAVNLQLQSYRQRVSLMAEDPAVIELATSETSLLPVPALTRYLNPFDTFFVAGTNGKQRARTSPKSREYMDRSFEFRDYFRGARRLAAQVCGASRDGEAGLRVQSAYVARAFVSESDGRFEFAVSAPLCRGSTWVGIVAGTVASEKVLGAVRLLSDKNGRISTVIGPRDRERAQADLSMPKSPTFMVHPGLPPGHLSTLRVPNQAKLLAGLGVDFGDEDITNRGGLRYSAPFRIDNYEDPVPGFEGAWAAVFAAADDSGYLVAVQSRRDVTPLRTALAQQLALPAGVPFGASLFGLVLFGWSRRRRDFR
jgi:eukaryotic-like serine/threonine-protein kinase